jgi:molybdopterin biosynthesis enzyme MoaB
MTKNTRIVILPGSPWAMHENLGMILDGSYNVIDILQSCGY